MTTTYQAGPLRGAPAFSSFYHLEGGVAPNTRCTGTACFAASDSASRTTSGDIEAGLDASRLYCLGRCYEAPAFSGGSDAGPPNVAVAPGTEGVVLGGLIAGGSSLDSYRARGGYQALTDALERGASELRGEVADSGIRGRGGAGYPAGAKWAAVAAATGQTKFVIANADEGDAGSYVDRFIIERDPHLLIEGMAIAARAVGAERGFVYLRREYPDAARVIRHALSEAREADVLGPDFDVEIVIGEGSYLCGEETAMIRSIEGRRPEPWARPPYPTEQGLFGMPTLVNNVETLASIPWIIRHGGSEYAAMGVSGSTGTKVVSLNSLFARPGLYEVELGTPLREIVDGIGGGLAGGELLGVMVGGPLAGIVPPHLLETPLAFDEMREIGCSVGHGGIIAFDKSTSIREIVEHVASFAAYESCGKCTPCREGSGLIESGFGVTAGVTAGAAAGAAGRMTASEADGLIEALSLTSLCGHGAGLGAFLEAVRRHFPQEYLACLG